MSTRCQAKTKKKDGSQCKNKAKENGYCHVHQSQAVGTNEPTTRPPPTADRGGASTTVGNGSTGRAGPTTPRDASRHRLLSPVTQGNNVNAGSTSANPRASPPRVSGSPVPEGGWVGRTAPVLLPPTPPLRMAQLMLSAMRCGRNAGRRLMT
jgi:hypothetical protein